VDQTQISKPSESLKPRQASLGPLLMGGCLFILALLMFFGGIGLVISRINNPAGRSLRTQGSPGELANIALQQVQALSQELETLLAQSDNFKKLKEAVQESDKAQELLNNPQILSMYVIYSEAGSNLTYLLKRHASPPIHAKKTVGETQQLGQPPIAAQELTFENASGEREDAQRFKVTIVNKAKGVSIIVTVFVRKDTP
jgi:hypothetical protein